MNLRQFFGQVDSRPVMFIPFIRDCEDWRCQEKVREMCRQCAQQLAGQLFIWKKSHPSSNTVKSWDAQQKRFVGMDISLFQGYLMQHFSIRTKDNREWLLDKSIAARIWEQCVSEDSPLPPADFTIEAERRREK